MKQFIFYLTLFLLILAYSTMANYFDFDLWARLIAGMGVIDGGHVLTQDFLSYTPVHTWWDHEWGAGVIFYAFLKFFGPYSLILLQALMVFGIFFTVSRVLNLRSNNPYNFLFYFFGLMGIMLNLNLPIRCHLFSFLFFTVFLYILEKDRKTNTKLIYLIPIITLFWGNIHGGVVSGIGLLLIYAAGEFLNKKPYKKYLILFVLSSLSLFINPWGVDYVKFLLMANTMPRPDIAEWYPIFSKYYLTKHLVFKMFLIVTLLSEIIIVAKQIKLSGFKEWYKNADKTKYLLILSMVYISLSHIKLMPFFVIIAICFIYDDFYEVIKKIEFPKWKNKAVYGVLLFLSVFTLISKNFSVPVGMEDYPVKEVEFLKVNKIEGKLLTSFGVGSYASYKLYPQNKIFMDGRYEEVYYDWTEKILKEFYLCRRPDYILDYHKPDVIIIENEFKQINEYLMKRGWDLVYRGKLFNVYLPHGAKNKRYTQPTDDMEYYKNNLFTTDIKFKSE